MRTTKSMIKPPPSPPTTRKVSNNKAYTYDSNTYVGRKYFKLKVSSFIILIIYVLSLMVSFSHMLYSQNGNGFSTIYFVGNAFLFGCYFLLKSIVWLYENWNKEIEI